ncbi:066L [Invertebrate iridescent virus Kaz2018]|uniref:066L n=1 Tax=Invertebrate iridescent virus 6 TaxID=176652 RepID=Q91G39_IIV6|nr:066L [Invertebrate iridescent virus 6]AAK81993.1 066L [Invertebrate iridescent virus 6]QNH08478.1 066L [Invertebrate iridescent virus Kaz2018]
MMVFILLNTTFFLIENFKKGIQPFFNFYSSLKLNRLNKVN